MRLKIGTYSIGISDSAIQEAESKEAFVKDMADRLKCDIKKEILKKKLGELYDAVKKKK